jgi:hypothetical protein
MKTQNIQNLTAKLFGFSVFGALAGVCSGAVYLSAKHQEKSRKLFEERSQIFVEMPSSPPELNQESIQIAMEAFSIKLPKEVSYPQFSATLEDRGLTTGGALEPTKQVFIGTPAFTSWAVLGSTLAHEIEIHGNQSFLKILLTDKLSSLSLSARNYVGEVVPAVKPSARTQFEEDGTWKAERDAYLYEVNQAKRFGLSQQEKNSILDVMSFYYPTKPATHAP